MKEMILERVILGFLVVQPVLLKTQGTSQYIVSDQFGYKPADSTGSDQAWWSDSGPVTTPGTSVELPPTIPKMKHFTLWAK